MPQSFERALIRFDVPLRLELEPGRLVLERQLLRPVVLEALVRGMVPAIADAVR